MTRLSRVGKWGLLALALSLAWLLSRGYADFLARPAPDRALALNASQPVALVHAAERALADRRFDDAEALASRALLTQPYEGTALRLLGAVAESRGDRTRALALMQWAVATTPRESSAQFWLAIHAAANQDIDAALLRLDRLLRFEPESQDDVFPFLALIAANPIGALPIARHLAVDPPWRAQFVSRLIRETENSADLSRLFRAIGASGGRVSNQELDQFAARLFARHEWPRLRRLIARLDAGGPQLLHDGGFDGGNPLALLGWTVTKIPGVDIQIGAAVQGETNRALRLVFLDRRVPFRNVAQSLLLEPGTYVLSGRARSLNLRTALGLGWVLSCVEGNATIAESGRLLGSHDWHPFELAFVVPEERCGGQTLTLVLAARIAAEQQVVGEAWFDDLAIRRLPPTTQEPRPNTRSDPGAKADQPPASG